jgi:hypothetical protein
MAFMDDLPKRPQKSGRKIIAAGLGIDDQQDNLAIVLAKKINHSRPTAPAHACPRSAHFAQGRKTWNDIARFRIFGNPVHEFIMLGITPTLPE